MSLPFKLNQKSLHLSPRTTDNLGDCLQGLHQDQDLESGSKKRIKVRVGTIYEFEIKF